MKKHKSNKSDKTVVSNGTAELFVLPPELLAKLGINLNNVPSQASTLAEDSNQTIGHNSCLNTLPENTDTSSIIVTANLMKESVFLSPTFQSNPSNIVPDEEEPLCSINNDSLNTIYPIPSKCSKISLSCNTETEDILMSEDITPELLHESIIINSNHEEIVKELDRLEVFESIKEYQVENQDGNLILADMPYQDIKKNINSYATSTPTSAGNKPNETYLSRYSNSSSKCSLEKFDSVSNKQTLVKGKEKSETVTRDLSQSKDTQDMLVKCSLSNFIFTPEMNSTTSGKVVQSDSNFSIAGAQSEIICTNQFNIRQSVIDSGDSNIDVSIQNINSDVSSEDFISWIPAYQRGKEIKSTKVDYDDHNKSIIHISDSINVKNHSKERNIALIDSECGIKIDKINSDEPLQKNVKFASTVPENDDKKAVSNNCNNQTHTVNNKRVPENGSNEEGNKEANVTLETKNDSLDRVKEIATYLSRIVNERRNLNRSKMNNRKAKPNSFKSELCIQGVEKPGGEVTQKEMIKCPKVLKTYQRTVIRKQIPTLIAMSDKIMTSDAFQLSRNPDKDIHDGSVTLRNSNEFCVCYDFGNLAYYDCEMLYEHIHFWPPSSIFSDPETLYSIYNDKYVVTKRSVDFIEDDHRDENSDNGRSSLCWNEVSVMSINNEQSGSLIDLEISREAGSSDEQRSSVNTVCRMNIPTSLTENVNAERGSNNRADTKNRKNSSIELFPVGVPDAEKNIECGIHNWERTKKEHYLVTGKIEKETKIHTTADVASTSNETRRNRYLPSNSLKENSIKSNDQSVASVPVTSTKKSVRELASKSTRRTSKTEIDFDSKTTTVSENSEKIEAEILATQVRRPKTDVTLKLSGQLNIVDVSSKSICITSKSENDNSLIGAKTLRSTKNSSVDIEPPETPRTKIQSLVNTYSDASKSLLTLTDKTRSPKNTKSSKNERTLSTLGESKLLQEDSIKKNYVLTNETEEKRKKNSKGTEGININTYTKKFTDASEIEPTLPTSKIILKTPNTDKNNEIPRSSSKIQSESLKLSTESTEIGELTKPIVTKKRLGPRDMLIEKAHSTKSDTDLINSARSSRKSSDLESEKEFNIATSTEIDSKTSIFTRKSSIIKIGYSHPAVNDTTKTNKNTVSSDKLIKNINSRVVSNAVGIYIPTKYSGSSNIESEFVLKSKNDSYSTNTGSSTESQISTPKSSKSSNILLDIKSVVTTVDKSLEKTVPSKIDETIIDVITHKKYSNPKVMSKLDIDSDVSVSTTKNIITGEKLKSLKRKPSCNGIKKSDFDLNISVETTNDQTLNSELNDSSNPTNDFDLPINVEMVTINKTTESAAPSKSTYMEIESLKSTKRPSTIGKIHTSAKKARDQVTNDYSTIENKMTKKLNSKMAETQNTLAINLGDTETSNIEHNKHIRKSSVTKVADEFVPQNLLTCKVENKAATNIPTKTTFFSVNKETDPSECNMAQSIKLNNLKVTEAVLPVKSTELFSESTDTIIKDNENYTVVIEVEVPMLPSDNLTKCGVCAKTVEESLWLEHISKEHDYRAWRESEPAWNLEDEEEVRIHLQVIAKQNDGLKCSKCGLVRKFAKAFMRHIKYCAEDEKNISNISTSSVDLNSTQEQENDDRPLSLSKSKRAKKEQNSVVVPLPPVTCGVCNLTVEGSTWIEHIRVEHKYLAWRSGEKPLNLDDEGEVKSHLQYISKNYGGLLCSKCGAKWNYVKKYLVHESLCNNGLDEDPDNSQNDTIIDVKFSPVVTCGICKLEVEGVNWLKHIQVAHEYMAWIDGETPLDVNDPVQVKEHLTKVVRMTGELVCMKCGTSRVYARAYMLHVKACTISGFEMKITKPATVDKDKYECGVCNEIGHIKKWKEHAFTNHYNIAWMVGELPINLRNFYAVEKYLKEYKKKYSLVCNHCKSTRTSCYGFYAHILTCGKTNEEIEAVHNVCEICNNKYLCVYRNQHAAYHREQEQRREIREYKAQKAAEEALKPPELDEQPMGKRRAAQKAKKVIEKYSSNVVDGKPVCACGATFENAEERNEHNCTQRQNNTDNDPDVSVKIELESADESGDTDIDSTISDCIEEEEEEQEQKKKKRRRTGEGSAKISRIPYRVSSYSDYLSQGYKDFAELHYTSDNLFNEWRDSECTVVPPNEMSTYLPPLNESCKVRFGSSDYSEWTTYQRFESKKVKGYSLFTGGAIQCISWVPHNVKDETFNNYLSVATHLAPDVPRHGPDERPEHPGLVQIWDFTQFNFPPKCVVGLAHEYGVVWAMEWCPSGARDPLPRAPGEAAPRYRLGLLALACSNGSCYILAVPCPPITDDQEFVMYKLNPVAELRLSMETDRRVYQATSLKWSHQKGHSLIIVGYSDGTTALYDLNSDSPFLKATADSGVTIFYPFEDKQSENSAVTGVGVSPSSHPQSSLSGYFSTSVTGASVWSWPRARPCVRGHAAVSAAHAAPLWPAVMLSGDSPFMKSVTELEWSGGRRLGASRAGAACGRCARVAAAAAPALRLVRCHPCYPEVKKQIIATLLMVPIGQKRKRKVNDDLSMVLEPLTYEDAIQKYGLQLALVPKKEQAAAQQLCNDNEICPERFPLSDIVAVAFCPSGRFHDKLAVATHAGIIFVLNT